VCKRASRHVRKCPFDQSLLMVSYSISLILPHKVSSRSSRSPALACFNPMDITDTSLPSLSAAGTTPQNLANGPPPFGQAPNGFDFDFYFDPDDRDFHFLQGLPDHGLLLDAHELQTADLPTNLKTAHEPEERTHATVSLTRCRKHANAESLYRFSSQQLKTHYPPIQTLVGGHQPALPAHQRWH